MDLRRSYAYVRSAKAVRRAEGHRSKTRTEVVYEDRGAFDERKHRILLQLHILRNLFDRVQSNAQLRVSRPPATVGETHGRFRDARHESAWKLKIFDALRDGVLLCLRLGGRGSVGVVLSWHVG
jgi:hypothetical protein